MTAMFGGIIAVVLLGLYVHLVQVAILVAGCVSTPGCAGYTAEYFNEGMAQALSVISGLISALVIAELAVTKSGDAPVARLLNKNSSAKAVRIVKIVSVFYILVWMATGLWAFIIGLYHPKGLPVLTNLGQAWFGVAVAAAYAYFGIKPQAT